MLGPNLNSRLDSPLPAYKSSSCPVSPPPPAHHFPPASFHPYLHLSPLSLGLRYGLREGSSGEGVVSIQPPKLGLSLSLFLGLRSQISQVFWEPISYLPKDLKSKLALSASPPSPSSRLFLHLHWTQSHCTHPCHSSRASCSMWPWPWDIAGQRGRGTCLCIDTLVPNSLSIPRAMPGHLAYPRPSCLLSPESPAALMPHSPLANKTNKKPVLLEELGSRYGMITLEFGIKNTETFLVKVICQTLQAWRWQSQYDWDNQ